MPPNSQFSGGGVPCFLYIICNNITLKSVKHEISRFVLPYVIQSCDRLKISCLTQNINTFDVY